MNSVSGFHNINYTAANVGVLTPPDNIARFKILTDSELEQNFQKTNNSIDSRVHKVTFENKHSTPFLVKVILGVIGITTLWKSGKHLFKK